MPTRLVLRETQPPSRLSSSSNHNLTEQEIQSIRATAAVTSSPYSTPPPNRNRRGSESRPSSTQRKVVGFRSSIIREFSSQPPSNTFNGEEPAAYEDFEVNNDEAGQQRRLQLHLSNEDIRASPRLLGYLFGGIASVVMLFSVVQFYLREEENNVDDHTVLPYDASKFPDDVFFHTLGGPVYRWKLWCCMAVATAGTMMFIVILFMHFDTICFPRIWFQFFRDGSLSERNLLMSLLVFWAISLHINTSSLSVGEVQANVFFTTWIVFVSMMLTMGVWRESADLPRLAMKILLHHRETTYNWCWTLLFVLITAGAATDMYFHRDQMSLKLKGESLALRWDDWMRVLGLVWSESLLCVVSIFFNHVWSGACKLNCPGGCRFVLNWRFLEGLIILGLVGFKFWIILEYTGSYGVINGLNNVYFGIWGSFFNIVFTFGTWLRENKDIDYII